jgi:hypothetical protein
MRSHMCLLLFLTALMACFDAERVRGACSSNYDTRWSHSEWDQGRVFQTFRRLRLDLLMSYIGHLQPYLISNFTIMVLFAGKDWFLYEYIEFNTQASCGKRRGWDRLAAKEPSLPCRDANGKTIVPYHDLEVGCLLLARGHQFCFNQQSGREEDHLITCTICLK